MPVLNLSDDTYKEILHLVRRYRKEAEKCEEAKAYLAGCILIGAAFEADLLAFINCYWDDALNSPLLPRRREKIKPLIEWSLVELIAVAKERNWLPSTLSLDDDWDDTKAKIGDYCEVLRQIRNLVHPARYVSDMPGRKILKKVFKICLQYPRCCNR